MNDKPPYSKWIGVLLGVMLHGSAHFLSGNRIAGLKWYFGLFACGMVDVAFLASPGTIPFVLGIVFLLASVALWVVMLKQSHRPIRRIGFLGWFAVVALAAGLNEGLSYLVGQFVQPFKVPTGAMEPTIYGVHGRALPTNSIDKPGTIKWLISGERYLAVKAEVSGVLSGPCFSHDSPFAWTYMVGSRPYDLPRFAPPLKQPGENVSTGETLWSGVITAGDHLFVERFSYRFGKPRRGDIVVFRTTGIPGLLPDTFYIKRIVGLPGERIRIEPPFLFVNNEKVTDPKIFSIIASESNGYAGFQLAGPISGLLSTPTGEVSLGSAEYFVLGDNTRNSRDSRYWGAVPEENIIGKTTRIYWPLTRINALNGR